MRKCTSLCFLFPHLLFLCPPVGLYQVLLKCSASSYRSIFCLHFQQTAMCVLHISCSNCPMTFSNDSITVSIQVSIVQKVHLLLLGETFPILYYFCESRTNTLHNLTPFYSLPGITCQPRSHTKPVLTFFGHQDLSKGCKQHARYLTTLFRDFFDVELKEIMVLVLIS